MVACRSLHAVDSSSLFRFTSLPSPVAVPAPSLSGRQALLQASAGDTRRSLSRTAADRTDKQQLVRLSVYPVEQKDRFGAFRLACAGMSVPNRKQCLTAGAAGTQTVCWLSPEPFFIRL